MNLVSVCNSTEKNLIWQFIHEYDSNLNPSTNKVLDDLIQHAINYYTDFILPNKKYLKINKESINVFKDLCSMLQNIDTKLSSEEIQTKIYEIGKNHNFKNLREFFKLIYQVLLGQDTGPRLGSFIKVFGIEKTYKLIEKNINDFQN